MNPVIYAFIFGIVVGWALAKWSDRSDVPQSEDQVSDECLRHIVRKAGRS